MISAFAATPALAYDWIQFNGDSTHSGNNTAETILGAGNVAQLAQRYQITLPGTVDSAPVFLEGVTTPAGVKDLLFVTTMNGWTVALDAATGATLWSRQNGPGACVATNGAACYTTSSPTIDPNRQYVYAYGLEGKAHKYQVGDGTEIIGGGWPQVTTLKGQTEKGASALSTATAGGTTYLYVAHGGYPGDAGDYQGHVTAINLATGVQKIFNATCSDQTGHLALNDPGCTSTRNAVWARPGVVYDAGTNRIFFGTGNGNYNAATGGRDWSESVLAINPDGTGVNGKPLDSFTPTNFQNLDNADADLGSTAPALLPVPANSNVQRLAVQGGKDQKLRLLNLANLSGQGAAGKTGGEVQAAFNVPQGGNVLSQPAVWVNPADDSTWVFVTTGSGISGLRLSIDASGNPTLVPQWQGTQAAQGASPLIANNLIYYATAGTVRALNPTTGALLWTGPNIGGTHWQSPIVANGALYVTGGSSRLTAFNLPTTPPTFTSATSATFQVGTAAAFTVRATGSPTPTLIESGALPDGVTFTAAAGVLAGTPTSTGTFALQFTATNGVSPDATQRFSLIVDSGPPHPATLTYNEPSCASFAVSGPPTALTFSCAAGGGTGVPVCTPSANPAAPAVGQATTISANCTNQPNPNSYVWTGGGCASASGSTCTVTKGRRTSVTFTVQGTSSAGTGSPGSVTVSWR